MTYNEKKSLYESIMKDVAKTVKRRLNEDLSDVESELKELVSSKKKGEPFYNNKSYPVLTTYCLLQLLKQLPKNEEVEKYKERFIHLIGNIYQRNLSTEFVRELNNNI